MSDFLSSLASSVHTSPGLYALLIGSGVSRSAGVPTAYDVLSDLLIRLARLNKTDTRDAFDWYCQTYGCEPDYSGVLERLARRPADRTRLLRQYFEPSAEDRERGVKVPAVAHRAIAELVGEGYIRVIVTTNFDRLMSSVTLRVAPMLTQRVAISP